MTQTNQKRSGLKHLFTPASDKLSLHGTLPNTILRSPTVLIAWGLWSVLGN